MFSKLSQETCSQAWTKMTFADFQATSGCIRKNSELSARLTLKIFAGVDVTEL